MKLNIYYTTALLHVFGTWFLQGVYSLNYRMVEAKKVSYAGICNTYVGNATDVIDCGRICDEKTFCHYFAYTTKCCLCIDQNHVYQKATFQQTSDSILVLVGSQQKIYQKTDFVNECLSNPCVHGSCDDREEGFYCECLAGYTGSQCNQDVDCGPIVTPTNGAILTDKTTFGGLANLSCNSGYVLTGSSDRTCQNNGLWSGVVTECYIPGPTEYIVVFPRAHSTTYCNAKSFYVTITAHENDVSISMLNKQTGATNNYQLSSGQVQVNTYSFSTYAYTAQNTVTNGKVLFVTITGAASVHVELPCTSAPYMYKVWPITNQHIKFYGMVTQRKYSSPHDFALVAKDDNTQVTIQYNYLSISTKTITLNKYQLYAHNTTTLYDVVEITADKPITVISVYRCINEGSSSCDGAAAQLPPVAQWSKEQFIPRFQLLSKNIDVNLTVISSENSNTITIQNASVQATYQLNKLQFLNIQSGAAALSFTCTHACLVQVIIPCNYEPDVAFITHPISYSTNTLKFSSKDPAIYQKNMVLTIVAQSSITSTLKFDGNAVVSWNPIPGKPFSYSNIAISEAVHTIIAQGKFSGYVIYKGGGGMVREIGSFISHA